MGNLGLKKFPEEAVEIPTPNQVDEIDRDYRFLSIILPMMAKYNHFDFLSSLDSSIASGSISV